MTDGSTLVPARGIFPGSKQYFDAKNVDVRGSIKVVRAMYSFDSVQRVSYAPPYKSYVELTWISCDQAKIDSGENLFYKVTDYYAGDMGTGQLVKSSTSKDGEENEASRWQKDYNETFTKKFCG